MTTTIPEMTTKPSTVKAASAVVTTLITEMTTTISESALPTTKEMLPMEHLKVTRQVTPKTMTGCHSGYKMHNGICYKAFNMDMNFLDASWACSTEGGSLAMPKDASTNNFLISLKNDVDDRGYFWLGLVDRRVEGVWEWVDGTPLGTGYSAWLPGEPNNWKNEDCAIYHGEKWHDDECSRFHMKFMCQHKPQALRSDGCRIGYKLLARTCVRLNFRKMTYEDAAKACKNEGARLAMPKTKELDIALRNLVRTEGQNMRFWIGLRDEGCFFLCKSRWLWDDGSTVGYKGWNPGKPSMRRWHRGIKLCAQYCSDLTGYPMWDDDDCRESRMFNKPIVGSCGVAAECATRN
ncbi:hypothetical protein Bbelb_200090 [Branchiostoma belcheri]|nr:hypothetical protein Bbelb_200090 [Branchiostoma belcheri]